MDTILVTGCKGQLGYDVSKELARRGITPFSCDIDEMDITNPKEVSSYLKANNPNAVIHCAAYTAVDKAEENQDLCYKVNVEGTVNIANVCKELDIPMMFFSTDYVFNGKGDIPFKVFDKPDPQSVYGMSKYKAEIEIRNILKQYFILRTSWVFGINGGNFVKTMLKLSETLDELKIVCDQIGSPTYTYDLAKIACDIITSNKFGIYHTTNEGYVSWADFAKAIFKYSNKNVNVIPVTTEEYGLSKAIRPKNSRLDKECLDINGFSRLPKWDDALKRYLKELEQK